MKKIFAFLLIAFLFSIAATSCTEQERAKSWGGTTNYTIPADEVFVNATWKDDNLWVICYKPSTKQYVMHESSSWGVMQGIVIISGGETPKADVEILPQAPPPPPTEK